MKRYALTIILLGVINYNLFSQQHVIDSLKSDIQYHLNDTLKLVGLKKISKIFIETQSDSALHYANVMLALAEDKYILYYISDAYDLLSNIYEQTGELGNCIVSIDSAKYYANLINDPLGVIYFATNKGSVYIKMGRYFEALQSFKEVKSIAEKINRPDRVISALNNIGAVYHFLGDDETSLDYFIQSYELRLKNNFTDKLAYSLNNIGAVYSKYGNYEEALDYHRKALETSVTLNDNYNYLIALINIGMDYDFLDDFDSSLVYYNKALSEAIQQNDKTSQAHVLERISSVYAENGDYAKALPLLLEALEISKLNGNKYDIAAFSNFLGIIYLNEENYAASLPLLENSLRIAKEIKAKKIIQDVYGSLNEYYYLTENAQQAFKYQKLFDAAKDSAYEAKTELKIANLKNQFELNQKLEELKLKDIELTTEKKISGERLSIIYIVGITVIVLLILLLYILLLYRKIWYQKRIISESEKKVVKLLEQEKELGKLKTQLISTVSHEFRTPMAIISSNVQLIRDFNDSMDDDMRMETLKYIYNGVDNMIAMMENFEVLDKNTILKFRPKLINFSQLCSSLAGELQSLPIYADRIKFVNNFGYTEVIMDSSLITHIVRNLLINALKFSGEKKVDFIIESGDDNKVIITVTDHGIGMSRVDIEKVFENFHRGSNAKNIKGTGVGMSVVKRCVDLHGGKIIVESKLDEGTTIKVALPFENRKG